MKVTFNREDLLAAITPAVSVAQTKNTMASVDGILFECPPSPRFGELGEHDGEGIDGDLCRISAFDLEKGLRTLVPCKIEEEGLYVINTVKILQIVRSLPSGEITLEIGDRGKVSVRGGFSEFSITAAPGEDFPSMPRFVGESRCLVPQRKLKALISETVFSVAQNDQRVSFNGGLFRIREGWLTAVGCDGNRLSAAKCEVTSSENGDRSEMIIPGRFLGELQKMLRDTEDDAELIIGRKNIVFRVDGTYYFTRMLDAEYMAYERLLPSTYMTQAFVSRAELLGAVERASIVTEDKLGGNGRSYVKLDFKGKEVSMSSVSAGGSVFERIPAAIDGADLSIGFNCRYLLEALKACPSDCDRLRIRLNTPGMGAVIEPAEGTTFLDAKPDPEVYGERLGNSPESPVPQSEREYREDMFMFFVMPIRMNN